MSINRQTKPPSNTADLTPYEKEFEPKEIESQPKQELKKPKREPVQKGDYKYQNIPVSIPVDLNRALTTYVNNQKEAGLKLFDKKTGTYKLVSKSSWIQYLVERELRREGWDKHCEF